MPTKQVRYFLVGAGSVLLTGSGIRFYRLIRTHTEDYFFAPHLLLAVLSLFISWTVIKVGVSRDEIPRRGAISLIRSGSLLMMLWGYRLYLLIETGTMGKGGLMVSEGLAILNVVMGAFVMCAGLKISRALRTSVTTPTGAGEGC